MTIKQLREYLTSLDISLDACEVVRPGDDHSYYKCSAKMEDAEQSKKEYFEYFDDANMSKGSKRVKVLVVG